MKPSPRFFSLHGASRLYVSTVWGKQRADNRQYVAKYDRGPIEMACDGSLIWPPVMTTTEGLLIVELSLAEAMLAAGIHGIDEMYPARVRIGWHAKIHQQRLGTAPVYVWIRVRRGIRLDEKWLRWPAEEKNPNPNMSWRKVPVKGSPDGADILGVSNKNWTSLFCTRRFVEAARVNKWKGFSFEVMDLPHPTGVFPKCVPEKVDYLGKQWPPKRWYPPGVEGCEGNLVGGSAAGGPTE